MQSTLGAFDRLAYRSQHWSLLIQATLVQEATRLVAGLPRPEISAPELRAVLRRRAELHDRDLANVEPCGNLHKQLSDSLPQCYICAVVAPGYRLAHIQENNLSHL